MNASQYYNYICLAHRPHVLILADLNPLKADPLTADRRIDQEFGGRAANDH